MNDTFWLNYPLNDAHNNVKPNHWMIWEATVSLRFVRLDLRQEIFLPTQTSHADCQQHLSMRRPKSGEWTCWIVHKKTERKYHAHSCFLSKIWLRALPGQYKWVLICFPSPSTWQSKSLQQMTASNMRLWWHTTHINITAHRFTQLVGTGTYRHAHYIHIEHQHTPLHTFPEHWNNISDHKQGV